MQMKTVSTVPTTAVLSEKLIPAVKGEFYDYDYLFTPIRSVFALLKCKSNKGRFVAELADLGSEANILFCFSDLGEVVIRSVNAVNSSGDFPTKFENDFFGCTKLGIAIISEDEFHNIRDAHDVSALTKLCEETCIHNDYSITLKKGMVFSAKSDIGKFGLFLVQEITGISVLVSCCHILL